MHKLDITRDALKTVSDLEAKQFRQVVRKIFALLSDPTPADSSKLTGYDYRRVDIGEYRIIYKLESDTVHIALLGKRNDDQVYKELSRK